MNIGLNLIYLVPGETGGMETYARELIPALVRERPDARITAFVNREAAKVEGPWNNLVECVRVPVSARRRAEWVVGEQLLVPRMAARSSVDVLHSLASTAPTVGGFARVVTIHDLIYRVYPEAHSWIRAAGMRILVPLAARGSHRVIVPSETTRRDLVGFLNVPHEKIDVIPEGVHGSAVAPTSESELRGRFGLGKRDVVLSASAKRPHKNLVRLLEAWSLIAPDERPMLVLPGYPTPHEEQLRHQAVRLGISSDICFAGWVSSEDLEGFYELARCVVFPSLYEGFGLPVLEAMSRGVPVACSGRASLAEVGGNAVLVFDPENPASIADAVRKLLGERSIAEALRAAGLERARMFTWDATARATVASYERALSACSVGGSHRVD